MKTLILTVGLPRSSKSTWSRSTGFPLVNPDGIRQALGVYPYNPSAEKMVWTIAHYMVESLFYAGHETVILDACSHTERRRNEWKSKDWTCKYKLFDTPKEVCIERAKLTNQEYLIPVIERMSRELVWPKEDLYEIQV